MQGTQNSVGGRLEAAKAVRDEQTAQLRAKTGDVLYPAAGAAASAPPKPITNESLGMRISQMARACFSPCTQGGQGFPSAERSDGGTWMRRKSLTSSFSV